MKEKNKSHLEKKNRYKVHPLQEHAVLDEN